MIVGQRRDEVDLEFLLLGQHHGFASLDVRIVRVKLREIVVPIESDQVAAEEAHHLVGLVHV